ncbi:MULTISPECIES: hypothetical protein [Bacillus]|nr:MULTISPECIES: hypothetical protein [Bacillus]
MRVLTASPKIVYGIAFEGGFVLMKKGTLSRHHIVRNGKKSP